MKNSAGKDDGNHVYIYRAADIEKDDDIALSWGGFILIGLLAGGDYHQACSWSISLGNS
jgi:holliday junction resolvase YEN1